MKRISRYILVFIAIIASAVALPKLYWLAFEKPNNASNVMYSCIDNDFMIQRHGKEKGYFDNKGNEYTRDEYEQKLPLFFSRQLMISGVMPDTINGVEMDMHVIGRAKSFFRLKPKDMAVPNIGLFPLFEAESGRAKLELPPDYFRINKRIEFIDAEQNKLNEQKSQMFTSVMQKRGFDFPAKLIAGLPTTRKSCDEGYLVIDNKDQLFHIKMIEAKPFVKKVNIPSGLKFKHISCVDLSDKKYYSYLISEDNSIFILTQDEYEIVRFPVESYNPAKDELRILSDLFNYNIIIKGENYIKNIVLDDDYNKIDEYNETWTKRSECTEGIAFSYIFPAQISMVNKYSSFNDFYFERTLGFNWLILNILLIIIHFFIIRKRNVKLGKHLLDFAIIAVTGIFGFIGVNFFQNKFFD